MPLRPCWCSTARRIFFLAVALRRRLSLARAGRPCRLVLVGAALVTGTPFSSTTCCSFRHRPGGTAFCSSTRSRRDIFGSATAVIDDVRSASASRESRKGTVRLLPLPSLSDRRAALELSGHRTVADASLVGGVRGVLVYSTWDWRGGWCYGPRFLTDGHSVSRAGARAGGREAVGWPRTAGVPGLRRLFDFGSGVGVFCFPGGGSVFLTAGGALEARRRTVLSRGAGRFSESRVLYKVAPVAGDLIRVLGLSRDAMI